MTRGVYNPNSRYLSNGYVLVVAPVGHPRALKRGHLAPKMIREHILIAEAALGHYLPANAEIHHVNREPADNRHQNLVICEDNAYHSLLHARQRVLDAGGDPNTQYNCKRCGVMKDLSDANYSLNKRNWTGRNYACKECVNRRDREGWASDRGVFVTLGPRRRVLEANIHLGAWRWANRLECGHTITYRRQVKGRKSMLCSVCQNNVAETPEEK